MRSFTRVIKERITIGVGFPKSSCLRVILGTNGGIAVNVTSSLEKNGGTIIVLPMIEDCREYCDRMSELCTRILEAPGCEETIDFGGVKLTKTQYEQLYEFVMKNRLVVKNGVR